MKTKIFSLSLLLLCFLVSVSIDCSFMFQPDAPGQHVVLDCEPSMIDIGEVVVGTVSEEPFVITNPVLFDDNGQISVMDPVDETRATVRVTGFSGCESGEIVTSVAGAFPLTLADFESADLIVRVNPQSIGGWHMSSCVLDPEWEIVSETTGLVTKSFCHLTIGGSAVAGPEPSCALQPGAELDFGEVEARTYRDLTLTISNETTDPLTTNQFRFLIGSPAFGCDHFGIQPADTEGVLGPGESKDISVRFEPDEAGSFECTRALSSLREPADPADPLIADACPADIVLRGTGVAGSLVWSDCSQFDITEDLHGVYGLSENEIYAVGDAFTVRTSLGACSWIDVPGPVEFDNVNLTDVWGISDEIWAVGNIPPPPGSYSQTGAIFQADISGWTKVDESWMVTYGALWGSAAENIYFVGTGISTDLANTKHWNGTVIDTLSIDWGMSELTGVHGTASDDVWAVLRQSIMSNSVYQFQGTDWAAQTLPFTPSPLHDVWAVNGTGFYAVYAVGEDGAIYHYDGSSWSDESIAGETDDFYGVWVSQTGQAWVVGQNGAIYHTSGTTWTLQNPPAGLERDLRDVWGSSDENVFAVGADGLILRYAR